MNKVHTGQRIEFMLVLAAIALLSHLTLQFGGWWGWGTEPLSSR